MSSTGKLPRGRPKKKGPTQVAFSIRLEPTLLEKVELIAAGCCLSRNRAIALCISSYDIADYVKANAIAYQNRRKFAMEQSVKPPIAISGGVVTAIPGRHSAPEHEAFSRPTKQSRDDGAADFAQQVRDRKPVTKAAAYLGIAKGTLDKMRSAGRGPRFMRLGSRVFYRKQDLDAYLNARFIETTDTRDLT